MERKEEKFKTMKDEMKQLQRIVFGYNAIDDQIILNRLRGQSFMFMLQPLMQQKRKLISFIIKFNLTSTQYIKKV